MSPWRSSFPSAAGRSRPSICPPQMVLAAPRCVDGNWLLYPSKGGENTQRKTRTNGRASLHTNRHIAFGVVVSVLFLLAVYGVVWAVAGLYIATEKDPYGYCSSLLPSTYEYVGESPTVTYQLSFLPFGVTCGYGNPVETRQFHGLGTSGVVVGLVSCALACLGAISWLAASVFSRLPGAQRGAREQ